MILVLLECIAPQFCGGICFLAGAVCIDSLFAEFNLCLKLGVNLITTTRAYLLVV